MKHFFIYFPLVFFFIFVYHLGYLYYMSTIFLLTNKGGINFLRALLLLLSSAHSEPRAHMVF